ncbi:MAG TPA: phosphoglucomutase/phosphomannomutase family protein [Chloroflexota bacterium]|nr:phosphoglucomutase/phosphomannomutase family protein [Chloroflexota bacterium]
MSTRIVFGTDGWRAVIADEYTFENVRRCARGMAELMRGKGLAERGVVIGYDTRFASEYFAAAAAETLAGSGVRAFLCTATEPTPVISHAILQQKAGGGITITASHNPWVYNGFKVRSDYGGAATPETIAELEELIDKVEGGTVPKVPLDDAKGRGLVQEIRPDDAYLAQINQLVDLAAIRNSRLKIVVDAMHGAGMGWFPRMLDGGTAEIVELNGNRNPWFDGRSPEPIGRNLQDLFSTVRGVSASVGLATDGDADRLGVCDEHGNFIDQLRVYSLLALYLLEARGFRGPIVKTLSTSSMLDRLGQLYGVPVYETAVGFKYVAPKMIETNALVGGEESGGYAFRGHIPERDGILAGLYFLDLMVKLDRTPSQLVDYLFSKVGPHYYDRLDVHFDPDERAAILDRLNHSDPRDLAGKPVARQLREDGFKYILADGAWLLIRFSGTEPIMRIYAEAASLEEVKAILDAGRQLAGVQA